MFNVIPVWQLDGSRGFHALGRAQRWIIVAVVLVALLLTGQRILVLVGAGAIWRAMQHQGGPGDTQTITTFIVLILALSGLARSVG
jgi:Zn-dependent protease